MGDVVWLFDGPYGSEPDREQLLVAVEFLRAELARLDDLMDQLDELDE